MFKKKASTDVITHTDKHPKVARPHLRDITKIKDFPVKISIIKVNSRIIIGINNQNSYR